MKKIYFLFFVIFISLISFSYAREAPIVLTYGLPENNPDITIEKKTGFDLFAIVVPKAEFMQDEIITIISKDLANWDSVCDDTKLIIDIYHSGDVLYKDFTDVGRLAGRVDIGTETEINIPFDVGTYEAQHYLWCADDWDTFRINNGCPILPQSGLCELYKNDQHRISNVEKVVFYVIGETCQPQTEICNNVDDDCDGQIDENNVCVDPCDNVCESGDKRCFGNKIQTCGKYDSDICLEYPIDGSGLTCGEGCESCGDGCAKCKEAPTNGNGEVPPTEVIEPELYAIYTSNKIKWDSTPPAIGLGIENKNNIELTRDVEMFYVAEGNPWYTKYKDALGGALQSILSPVPEIEEITSCVPEEHPKQTVRVTLIPNTGITFWMNPDLPTTSSTFGGQSNYNANGDYLLYAGVYKKCSTPEDPQGHTSTIGKVVELKTGITVPEQICQDKWKYDDDQDGLVYWADNDCRPPETECCRIDSQSGTIFKFILKSECSGADMISRAKVPDDKCPTTPYCGDGSCGVGENKDNCPEDCEIQSLCNIKTGENCQKKSPIEANKVSSLTDRDLIAHQCTANSECSNDNCIPMRKLIDDGFLTEEEAEDTIFTLKTTITGAGIGAIGGAIACVLAGTAYTTSVISTAGASLVTAPVLVPAIVTLCTGGGAIAGGLAGYWGAEAVDAIESGDLNKVGYCVEKEGGKGIGEQLGDYDPCIWGKDLAGEKYGCFAGWVIAILGILIVLKLVNQIFSPK